MKLYPATYQVMRGKQWVKSDYSLADKIIELVSLRLSIRASLIVGKGRRREVVEARQLAMYFLRQYSGMSFNSIANIFSERHHTTAIHAIETVKNLCATDPKYLKDFTILQEAINMRINN